MVHGEDDGGGGGDGDDGADGNGDGKDDGDDGDGSVYDNGVAAVVWRWQWQWWDGASNHLIHERSSAA